MGRVRSHTSARRATGLLLALGLLLQFALPAAERLYCPKADRFFTAAACCEGEGDGQGTELRAVHQCCCRVVETARLADVTLGDPVRAQLAPPVQVSLAPAALTTALPSAATARHEPRTSAGPPMPVRLQTLRFLV